MENVRTATIAGRARACAIRLNEVVSQSHQAMPAFEDQLARFNIWAANIGVFAEGHASLDYRVRNSNKVKAMVMQLLQTLQRKLQFALDTVERTKKIESDAKTSDTSNIKIDDTDSEGSQSEASNTSSISTSSSGTSVSRRTSSNPLFKSSKDVEAAIDRLHRLAVSIRKSSTHNRTSAPAKFTLLDENGDDTSSRFESFALKIIQARFPTANPILHKRLASMVLQRRKLFSYQQRHQQKLAKVVSPATRHFLMQQQPRGYAGMPLTLLSESLHEAGLPNPRAIPKGLVINKALSTTTASALTATSLSRPAPSVMSSSRASSNHDTSTTPFPPPPKIAPNAKEFQCPYCGLLLELKERNSRRWRKHILNDLEPYVCLFENCNMDSQSYRTINSWTEHMRLTHTLRWYCGVSSCQSKVFDEKTMFENHLELFHSGTYSSSQLPMLVESMKRPATELFECCPLCNYIPDSQQTSLVGRRVPDYVEKSHNLHKHIAAHLEGLALLSLPWHNDVDDIPSSRGTQEKEERSILSRDAGVKDLDDVSLVFDDPPSLELLVDNQQEQVNTLLSNAASGTPGNSESWEFLPSIPYVGQLDDLVLQNFVRQYLSTQLGELSPKPRMDSKIGNDSTRAELQKICTWISPMNFAEKHAQVSAMRQEGTCEWFLESTVMTNFIAHTEKVVWATGIPGSGKTVLSSAAIEYLKNFALSASHSTAVAYAYCDYQLQESYTTIYLIACFLRQLLEAFWETNQMIPESIQALYSLHREAKTSPSMAEYLEVFKDVIELCGSIFIVIDALDECSYKTRQEIIKTISSIQPGIHLLLTSRPLGDIEKKLGDVSRVDIVASGKDLKSYAQRCIERDSVLQQATLLSESREALPDKIVQRAAGMFSMVPFLIKSYTRGIRNPNLSQIFLESDKYWFKCVLRTFEQPASQTILARFVLAWVAFARRPLTFKQLAHIIGTELISDAAASLQGMKADSELFITVCAGIIATDPSGILRPVHAILEEYFQRNKGFLFGDWQRSITSSCVGYLSFTESGKGPCTTDSAMLARLKRSPLLHYAASEWGHHALGPCETICKDSIIEFLSNKLAVESAVQAKHMPPDWKSYPQSIDCQAYPHEVPGIALAAFFGLTTIVEAMLAESGNDSKAALFWAAKGGSTEVAKLFLARGVSPNVPGAIRVAAENGHEDVIRVLVENGGDVNAKYDEDGNALQTAAIKGNEPLIRLLLKYGADPNIEGGELGSVLHIAAVNGDETITQLLLKNGADPNTKGGMYGFALQAAVEEGHVKIVKMLLENGADVNLEGGPYGNAFQAAAENGDKDIVELLLAHGANIDTMIGGEKYTALQEVARRGSEEMVELLIEKGANINSRQRNGQTALHQAAKEGQAGVVALLLKKGANRNTRDQRGSTALDWAKKKGFSEVVKVLEAA